MRPLASALCLVLATQSIAAAKEAGSETKLKGELAKLQPIVGVWKVDAAWSNGTPIWAVAEWRPVLDGAWLQAETYVKEPGPDGEERLYHRYTSFIGWDDKNKTITGWAFSNGGPITNEPMDYDTIDGRLAMTSEFSMGQMEVLDRTMIDAEGNLDWNVQVRAVGADEWSEAIDDQWVRVDESVLAEARDQIGTPELIDSAGKLEPFVGDWEIDAEWAMGGTLEATEHNTPILGGHFLISNVNASDDGGPAYNRYRTVWAPAEDGSLDLYTFQHTGGVLVAKATTEEIDGKTVYSVSNTDEATPFDVKQTLSFDGPDAFSWTVMGRPKGGDQWNTMMDDQWTRIDADPEAEPEQEKPEAMRNAKPIDPNLFDASGPEVRFFTKTRRIATDRPTAFRAFTDGGFWPAAYDPTREGMAANIDLAIGGRYEWLWDGKVGSNGCQVLSYIPGKMVSFTWNSPPSHATRDRHTWVVVEFDEDQTGTTITLTHAGFGEGPEWDETHDYFKSAWDVVLDSFEKNLAGKSYSAR